MAVRAGPRRGGQRGVHEGSEVEVPHRDEPGERQRPERQGDQRVHVRGQNDEPAPVDAVGDDPPGQGEHDGGRAAHQTGEPGQQRRARDLVDQPQLDGALELVADGRADERDVQQPEITDGQGGQAAFPARR